MARRSRNTDEEVIEVKSLTKAQIIRRLIIVGLCLVIAGVSFGYGVSELFSTSSGWTEIEISSSDTNQNGEELYFVYNLGQGDTSARQEKIALVSLYTEAVETSYELLDIYYEYDDVVNFCTINNHPNEILTVDDFLYEVFEEIVESGNRLMYLGPIYHHYEYVLSASNDYNASLYDHMIDEVLIEQASQIVSFANDEEAVSIELLGDNQIRLNVSDEYLAYVEENELSVYIDLGWMKNAFEIDYIADVLIANGYTSGSLSTCDGYYRCLDDSGTIEYSLNVYSLTDDGIVACGSFNYTEAYSIIRMQNCSIDDTLNLYYTYEDGSIRSRYLSIEDASCKMAVSELISYSTTLSCSELALSLADIYISEELDEEALNSLTNLNSIYVIDENIYYNDADMSFSDLYDGYNLVEVDQ